MALADLLTPDGYQSYVLPAMAVAEAIATRGRDPGSSALQQMGILQQAKQKQQEDARQAMLDEESAKQKALSQRLGEFKLQNEQTTASQKQENQAAVNALKVRLGQDPDLDDTEKAFYNAYPGSYADALDKEEKAPAKVIKDTDEGIVAIDPVTGTATPIQGAGKHLYHPVKPIPTNASGMDEKQQRMRNAAQKIDQAKYDKEVMGGRGGGGNLVAANAAIGSLTQLLAPGYTPNQSDISIIKDQLSNLVKPGFALNNTQFQHLNAGGALDRIKNLTAVLDRGETLDENQKKQYKQTVGVLSKELGARHQEVIKDILAQAHNESVQNGWTGPDSIVVNTRKFDFDNPTAAPAAPSAKDPLGLGL